MKAIILQQDLLPVLQSVSRSTGVRSTLPVLANILIQTENGRLKLTATNLEIGVIKSLNAEIIESGEISVPSKIFLEVVSSLQGLKITLESTDNQLYISTNNFSATLNGIPSNEFPLIPLTSENTVSVDAIFLKKVLPKITFAAATDEGRPVLTGILTQINNGYFELVATDGFRLSHQKSKFKGDGNFKALIPRRTFEEIVKLITEDGLDDGKKIEVSTSDNQNQILFTFGTTKVSSRLIEGQFPNWEKIIPSNFENKSIIDRVELQNAVKLASFFAKDLASVIKLQTTQNKITLLSESKEYGFQKNELDVESEGTDLIIAFNSKFLTDVLSACSSSKISIQFSGSLSPTLIKPLEEDGLEYIVMPVRLS